MRRGKAHVRGGALPPQTAQVWLRRGNREEDEEEEGEEEEEEKVAGGLTGWLLESLGRADDHMQEAVQAGSFLVWKTGKDATSQVLAVGEATHVEKSFAVATARAVYKTIYVSYDSQDLLRWCGTSLKKPQVTLEVPSLVLQCCGLKSFPTYNPTYFKLFCGSTVTPVKRNFTGLFFRKATQLLVCSLLHKKSLNLVGF